MNDLELDLRVALRSLNFALNVLSDLNWMAQHAERDEEPMAPDRVITRTQTAIGSLEKAEHLLLRHWLDLSN